ncbi:MAG: hypothetical protein J6584_00090 [Lactobacillus sp.]|uniref:hypothetical protein n=1 Tax=Bombilactobacillus bombi TaxID=1303590 RepID=UPI0035EE968E|nr:hypothetical protein [Lactobacillus sp.]
MQLQQLIVTNFRQFGERHSLHFATEGQQNVTLIIGNQEIDRTDIWRAILFAFLGDARIGQESDEINQRLINYSILQSAPNQWLKAEVELFFEQDGTQYDLIRRVRGYYDGKKYKQSPQKCWLEIKSPHQEKEQFNDEQIVKQKIQKALSPKSMLFGDAESLELLTAIDNASAFTQKLQAIIYHLLNTADIKQAIKLSSKLKSQLQLVMSDNDSSDYFQSIKHQQTNLSTKIQTIKQNRDQHQQQYTQAQDQLKLLTQLKPRITASSNKKPIIFNEKPQLNKMAEFVKLGANQLFYDYCSDITMIINNLRNHSEESISEKILINTANSQKCYLCGREFTSDSEAKTHVNELRQSFNHTKSLACLNQIEAGINEVEKNHYYFQQEQTKALAEYKEFLQTITENHDESDSVHDNDGITPIIDQLQNQIQELASQNQQEQLQLRHLKQEHITLQTEILEYQQMLQQLPTKIKNSNLLQQIIDSIDEIYTTATLEKLQTTTKEIFQNLQAKTKPDVAANLLTNAYQKNLTASQKQLLIIAFILALLQINNFNVLLTEQPFSYLNTVNYRYLIAGMPQLFNQWIVYLTDTELTAELKTAFLKQDNVGRIYQLNNHIMSGATNVEALRSLTAIL